MIRQGGKSKPMIEAIIKIEVPPEKRKELLQTFKGLLGPIRGEQGCLRCNCYVDIEAENFFCFLEEWQTHEDLDAHLRSVQFGVLNGAMSLLEMEPEIRFCTIATTAGAEAVAAARK